MTFLKIPYFFFSCLTFPLIVPLNEKMIAFPALISVFMMEKKNYGGHGKILSWRMVFFFFLPLAGLFIRAGFSPQIFSKNFEKVTFSAVFQD